MANEIARTLRKRMTPQEVKLWKQLRALRTLGHHFRRQSPIASYIVDFECRRSKLVIEVDGGQHGSGRQQRKDIDRDLHLRRLGYCVLRVWNNQIDRELEGVMQAVLQALHERPPHPAHAAQVRRDPPSPEGEG